MGFCVWQKWVYLKQCDGLYLTHYRKSPKFSDTQNVCCNYPKIQIKKYFHGDICAKDADVMANSEDLDQTAPCSEPALFAYACLKT